MYLYLIILTISSTVGLQVWRTQDFIFGIREFGFCFCGICDNRF
jgi:hypothetical protein